MGKMRVRLKTGRKSRRWSKGQSSESNPPISRFRSQANNRFFQPLQQKQSHNGQQQQRTATLTANALKKHDALLGLSSLSLIGGDSTSTHDTASVTTAATNTTAGRHSVYTFASDIVHSDALPFDRLLASMRKDCRLYREVLALLAAVTDTVREQSGKDGVSDTFAALVTVLDTVSQDRDRADAPAPTQSTDTKHEAICYLLSMYIRHVPRPVLVQLCAECCRVFVTALNRASSSPAAVTPAAAATDDDGAGAGDSLTEGRDEGGGDGGASGTTLQQRCLLECLVFTLKAQPRHAWRAGKTRNSSGASAGGEHIVSVFNTLLQYVVHSKPKLRKVGQKGVVSVLFDNKNDDDTDDCVGGGVGDETGSGGGRTCHPAAKRVADFCVSSVEACGVTGNTVSVQHTLQLLARTMPAFSRADAKRCLELLLRLLAWPQPHMRLSCLQTLCAFVGKCSAGVPVSVSVAGSGEAMAGSGVACLPATTCAQMIVSLYDFRPAAADAQLLTAWLATIRAAVVYLWRAGAVQLCASHLVGLFAAATQLWSSKRQSVRETVTHTLCQLLDTVVRNLADNSSSDSAVDQAMEKCFNSVALGLKYQSIDAWAGVLVTLARFFSVYGARGRHFMGATLRSLVELRDVDGFSYVAELETAVAAAITSLGPRTLIENVPLQLTSSSSSSRDSDSASGDQHLRRSWLLPIMRQSIRNTELGYFADYFVPLADSMQLEARACQRTGRQHLIKVYQTLEQQIWQLLPGFCLYTTDVSASFGRLAKTLGSLLTTNGQLRPVIMTALRNLIVHSCSSAEHTATLARFAKNYLPILFNLYTNMAASGEQNGQRAAVYQTIAVYLGITDHTLAKQLCDKCLEKLGSDAAATDSAATTTTAIDDQERAHIFDLLKLMLALVDTSQLNRVWLAISACMVASGTFSQKAAYRLLDELCKTDSCRHFVVSARAKVFNLLRKALPLNTSSAKSHRLNCIASFLDHLSARDESFVVEILPEAVLGCKEANSRTRQAAFTLIGKIGRCLQVWHAAAAADGEGEGSGGGEISGGDGVDCDKRDAAAAEMALRRYIQLLLAGLTGSPRMMAATNLAVARVVHVFRDILPTDLVELIVDNTCVLVSSASREPVECCFSLLKALVFALPLAHFARHLAQVLRALSTMTDDCKRHFRLKVRELLVLLVRKFGFDVVSSVAPKNDLILNKRLKNIEKLNIRKERVRDGQLGSSRTDLSDSSMKLHRTKSVEEILNMADKCDDDDDDEEYADNDDAASASHSNRAWIREETDGVVDLLDPSASRQITSTRPVDLEARRQKRAAASSGQFAFSDDHRLIVTDGKTADDSHYDDEDDDDDDVNADFIESINMTQRKRRKASGSVASGGGSSGWRSTGRSVSSGIYRDTASAISTVTARHTGSHKPNKRTRVETPGHEYAGRKGRGDMKRSGKLEPYAYVPLSRSALNKRKQAKSHGQFKSLVRGAQKGSARGRRLHSQNRKQ